MIPLVLALSLGVTNVSVPVTYSATAYAKTTKVTIKAPMKVTCEDISFIAFVTYKDEAGQTYDATSNELCIRVCRINPVTVTFTTEGVTRQMTLK